MKLEKYISSNTVLAVAPRTIVLNADALTIVATQNDKVAMALSAMFYEVVQGAAVRN